MSKRDQRGVARGVGPVYATPASFLMLPWVDRTAPMVCEAGICVCCFER